MSNVVGLTGPTGSGKSSASAVAAKMGINVVDCDKLARVAVEKGTPGLAKLVDVFGSDILNDDGTLNRKKLASIAFSDSESTDLLNKTILPFIVELVTKEAKEEKVILDAPTLFESGINKICKKNIAVLADKEIRLERIIKRDKLTISEAELRINAGKDDSFYKQNADYVIYNNDDEQLFKENFNKILNEIFGGC